LALVLSFTPFGYAQPPATSIQGTTTHAPAGVVCLSTSEATNPSKEFRNADQQAALAIHEGRWADVVRHLEEAAPFAGDSRQWNAIEQVRVGAFHNLGDTANEIASMEAALAMGCLPNAIRKNYEQMLPDLRNRLPAPQ
jgi:hypothetical protein